MKKIFYKKQITDAGFSIVRIDLDGVTWWIPEDESNRHYQEYLSWLAEGNEPEVVE
jgi:hypothetical protein